MSKGYQIHLENYTGPVTSLLIVEDFILCGCGSEISVYNFHSFQLLSKRQILHGATVHGIRKGSKQDNGYLLCAFGGKQACIVHLNYSESYARLNVLAPIIQAGDWIWDVHWLLSQEENDGDLVLALAHNSVLKCKWQTGEITERRECAEKCILYTARFIGLYWENLLLAAGTVFNQVVLWPVAREEQQISLTQKPVDPILTLSGHKGVIFSICYHTKFQRICSVSDDRSIRLWQLKFPTGSSDEPTVQDWKSVECSLLLSLFGHSARVWDVALLSDTFISIAEDAVCLVWDYKGNILKKLKGHKGRSIWSLAVSEDEKCVLTGGGDASIRQWQIHQVQEKETTQSVIKIVENCKETGDDFPRSVQLLNFDTILIMMNSGRLYSYKVCDQQFHLIAHDTKFRSYSILAVSPDETTIAIGTISGTVKIIRFSAEGEVVNDNEKFYEGKVLDIVWLDVEHILISGPDGNCLIVNLEVHADEDRKSYITLTVQQRLFLPAAKHRWITAACYVPRQHDINRVTLVCGDKDGSVLLYFLNNKGSSLDKVEPQQIFVRVHGKAGTTFVSYREGYIYSAGRDGFYRKWQMQNDTLILLHGSKVVKGFEWIERLEWNQEDLLVYGFFSSQFVVWSVNFNQQVMSAVCGGGHRSWGCCHDGGVMRFVYLKAGSINMVDRGNLAKQTIVKPALHGREVCDVKFVHTTESETSGLMNIVCSGSEDNTIHIGIFAKQNGLTCWTPLTIIKGHLSSVRALALSYTIKTGQSLHQCKNQIESAGEEDNINFLLFSGGGRAEIRAWKVKIDPAGQHTLNNKPPEYPVQESTDTLAGGDQLDLDRELSLDKRQTFQFSVSENFICSYEHLCTHFLGESRHKQQYSSWKTRRLCLDPETRIMSLAALPLVQLVDMESCDQRLAQTPGDFLRYQVLSAAGSDGNFRIFLFDEVLKEFKLLLKSSFHHGCVLKVLHYVHKRGPTNTAFALSASTNGQIVVWSLGALLEGIIPHLKPEKDYCIKTSSGVNEGSDSSGSSTDEEDEGVYTDFNCGDAHAAKEEKKPCCVLTANQSGINSLHALQISESRFMLASGGDDNAICVQLLELESNTLTLVAKGINANAHAAQITGICLVSLSLLISTSIDQRLNIWKIQITPANTIEFQMSASKFINIANVSNMDIRLYRDSVYMCIIGEGICLYKFKNTEDVPET